MFYYNGSEFDEILQIHLEFGTILFLPVKSLVQSTNGASVFWGDRSGYLSNECLKSMSHFVWLCFYTHFKN